MESGRRAWFFVSSGGGESGLLGFREFGWFGLFVGGLIGNGGFVELVLFI